MTLLAKLVLSRKSCLQFKDWVLGALSDRHLEFGPLAVKVFIQDKVQATKQIKVIFGYRPYFLLTY